MNRTHRILILSPLCLFAVGAVVNLTARSVETPAGEIAAVSAQPPGDTPGDGLRVTVSYKGVPLTDVISDLNAKLGKPGYIRVSPEVIAEGLTVTVMVRDLAIDSLLEVIANVHGLHVARDGDGIVLRRESVEEVEDSEADGDIAEPERKLQATGLRLSEVRVATLGVEGGVGMSQRRSRHDAFAPSPMLMPVSGGDEAWNREAYEAIRENRFESPWAAPLSTFSIDVDGASYANVRGQIEAGRAVVPDSVRIEEFVNYFPYAYPAPAPDAEAPFAVVVDAAEAPWNPANRLVRIGIKAKEIPWEDRPDSNLVFLIDVSGSMNAQNKLPLVKDSLRLLVEQLDANDRVAIVVYAGAAGVVLPSTTANNTETILHALDNLRAGGSTNGGEGIRLAYRIARENRIEGGTNRVVLCTDGDFNVGTSSEGELTRLIEKEAADGTQLTLLGFGRGNFQDDRMEALSNRGNGNYAYIDSLNEGRRVFLHQLTGTLLTVASDVKIQVEFNPQEVASYRLVGYENRLLRAEDFADDTVDAGEIGAGHTVTALYEIVPVKSATETAEEDKDLRYQDRTVRPERAGELLNVAIRYKQPGATESVRMDVPFVDPGGVMEAADADFRFAAAVAGWAQILRESEHAGTLDGQSLREIAASAIGRDPGGYRAEFVGLLSRWERSLEPQESSGGERSEP